MKILVLSDSHGDIDCMFRAAKQTEPDLILHLGDYIRDCAALRKVVHTPIRSVRGNCDINSYGLEIDEFMLENKKIFMTHGHLFRVKMGYDSLFNEARRRDAHIALFGHTHIAFSDKRDGMIMLNPGSQKTCAVLQIEHDAIEYEIKIID